VYTSDRTNYNSSRIGVLGDTGAFVSSNELCFQASDLGAPGIQRRLAIDPDGNLWLYSLVNATGGWTVSWVALNQPCSVHGLWGKNAVCENQPSLRCSCIPPPLEEAPAAASRRCYHGHAAAQVRPPARETLFRPMSACFERIPGGSRVLVRPFTDRAWDYRGLRRPWPPLQGGPQGGGSWCASAPG
jgi:hypothetical protein